MAWIADYSHQGLSDEIEGLEKRRRDLQDLSVRTSIISMFIMIIATTFIFVHVS